ncbi:MAG: sulfite exporter TauE/SafE family protein [Sphingobacteriaceae bacterium]|nr:sulfite exporter TauE/SafE family protein [Sphingobacteriaceae bacterium]
MSSLPFAFLIGLFGSLHCAVMCGPIMLGLPLQKNNVWNATFQFFLYQIGRILVYTILGFLLGTLGSSMRLLSNQNTVSVVIGSLLIVFSLLQFTSYQKNISNIQYTLLNPLSKLMAKVFKLPFWGFFAGMLNGLIPCGMVYLALATALNTTSTQNGAIFMLLFGLGTTPLLMMISLGGFYLKKYIRFNTQKLIPFFMLFIGLLFVLRASNLGIPFLSPNVGGHQYPNSINCN